ncbi:MAG TPA: hypothetical protein DF614_01940 [Methylococcaceae bacterium]|nr:hypothetical protein [Methylococcaceae bacterium]
MKKIIVLTLLALSIQQASAACKQTDARGTWVTYQTAFVTPFGEKDSHVGQCKLVVDAKGVVNSASSVCEFVTFQTEKMPTGGTFTVNADCSADINLELGGFVGQVQLTTTKNAYIGRFETETVSGTTNGVKQ